MPSPLRIGDVFLARCPRCRKGNVSNAFLGIRARCPVCEYDCHPEPGFYMGAMVVSSLLTAILIIPVIIGIKLYNPDFGMELLVWPFLEAVVLGSLLLRYSRLLWLHLEYRMTDRLDGDRPMR